MADHGVISSPGTSVDTTSQQLKLDPRKHVKLGPEKVYDVAATDFPGHSPHEEHAWDLETFSKNLHVAIGRLLDDRIEFDLVGVDASIANALRRILISEVPTVAVESVYVWNNTSLVHDEVLAQRLGLVPIRVDPARIQVKDGEPTDRNTIVFSLVTHCERIRDAPKSETDPEKLYTKPNVTTSDMIWSPKGEQDAMFGEGEEPRPVRDDILLVKMRPGQELAAELHCEKGVGRDHAKFSPVATASYRLLPHIIIHKPIPPPLCDKFASCFSPGVIRVQRHATTGEKECVVANPRKDTVSREVLRHPEFEGLVTLGRVRDHFIFNIESTGVYEPEALVPAACSVLLDKISTVRRSLQGLLARSDGLAETGTLDGMQVDG